MRGVCQIGVTHVGTQVGYHILPTGSKGTKRQNTCISVADANMDMWKDGIRNDHIGGDPLVLQYKIT